jgi:outer membrane receptor protein involved in Fe transport
MTNKYLRILSSTLAITLIATVVCAQTTTGTFLGFVTDANSAVIAGAKVTATNEATGLTRTVVTNSSGEYVISLLPVGKYTLKFEADSFKQRAIKGVILELDQKAKIDASLEVGQITEIVTSEDGAGVPLTRTETAEAGEVIENKRITDLPLNGRLYLQLAQLTPGVVENARGGFGQQLAGVSGPRITVMGARESDNFFTLDGVSFTDPFYNTASGPLSVDAIQEFNVRSSLYSAESGRLGGAQINIAIKTGTNEPHGSAYGFLRNDEFDARNFFDTTKPEFRQSQFGGTIGGPVIKDKLFYFGNYEGLRLAKSLTRTFTAPTASLRSGQFATPIRDPLTGLNFANNTIPDSRISPVAKGLLQFVPLPNRPGAANNLIDSPQELNDGDQFTVKTNYRRSANDEGFVRYTYYDVDAFQPYGFVAFASSPISLPGFGLFLQQRSQNVAIAETHIFKPTLIGEFRFGFNRTSGGQLQQNNNVDFASQFNIAGASRDLTDRGLPRITLAPFNAFGDVATPISRRDNDYQFNYNLSWFLGNHSLNLGGTYKRVQFNPFIPSNKRGQFTFDGRYTGNVFADFLLGLPGSAQGGAGSTAVYLRGNEYYAYAQDDWKVSKRLTVNLGLRYEYVSPLSEKFNRWATLDIQNRRVIVASEDGRFPRELFIPGIEQQLAPLPIVTSEDAGLDRSLVNKDRNNFAPRVGLAFDLFGNQRTVIRAGYGVYYNVASYNAVSLMAQNPPFFKRIGANNPAANATTLPPFGSIAPIESLLGNPLLGLPGFQPFDIDFKSPYFQQFNFGIQQLLTRDLLVEAQYLGSQGRHLYTNVFYNLPNPSATTPISARALFPNLGNFAQQAGAARSNYNALVLRAEKRLSFGLMVSGSYTFSKSLDNDSLGNSVVSSNLDQSNIKDLEYALSSFDIRHRLIVSFTYDLPFKSGNRALNAILGNWQAGGIIAQQTGQPFTVNFTGDRANTGQLNQRPNLVGDANLPDGQRAVERWFNTGAFVVAPAGTLGAAGRNILEGPGTNLVDFSLLKNIPLSERQRLQFRSEFFNLFNHSNFDFPERFCGGTLTGAPCAAATFGRVTAARDPRILQFALKYLF